MKNMNENLNKVSDALHYFARKWGMTVTQYDELLELFKYIQEAAVKEAKK